MTYILYVVNMVNILLIRFYIYRKKAEINIIIIIITNRFIEKSGLVIV